MENIPAVYPKASNRLGLWNGRATLRHDCSCGCKSVYVYFLTEEQKTQFDLGKLKYKSLCKIWKKDGYPNCHEQAFIIQALLDAKIPPRKWGQYTKRLEEINTQIKGFTADHRDQLHPDFYQDTDHEDDHPLVKEVRRYLAETA